MQSFFPDQLLIKVDEEVSRSEERHSSGQSHQKPGHFTCMLPMTNLLINRTGSPLSQLRSRYANASRERKVVASLQLSHRNRPRILNSVNDNYCVKCVNGLKDCACVSGKESLNPSPMMAGSKNLTSKSETVNILVNSCVANVHSVTGLLQKKGVIPNYCHNYKEIKYVRCFLCRSVEFCKSCHKCPNCCYRSTCRGQTAPVLEKMGSPGGKSQACNRTQRELHPPLPVLAKFDQVTHSHKLLCESPQKQLPVGGIASASDQICSRTGNHSKVTRVLQPTIFGAQTQQPVETGILDLSTLNTFLSTESFKIETPETIRTSLQAGEWVTSIDFKDA